MKCSEPAADDTHTECTLEACPRSAKSGSFPSWGTLPASLPQHPFAAGALLYIPRTCGYRRGRAKAFYLHLFRVFSRVFPASMAINSPFLRDVCKKTPPLVAYLFSIAYFCPRILYRDENFTRFLLYRAPRLPPFPDRHRVDGNVRRYLRAPFC